MPNAHGQLTREDFKAPAGQFRIIRGASDRQSSIIGDFHEVEFAIMVLLAVRATYRQYSFALYDENGLTNDHIRMTKPQRLLSFLREGSPASLHWIDQLREELSKAGQCLAYIGTDQDELNRHKVKICRRAVREAYEDLRRRPGNHPAYETIVEMSRIGGFKSWEEAGGKTDRELREYAWLRD